MSTPSEIADAISELTLLPSQRPVTHETIRLYCRALADLDADDLRDAVDRLVATEKWFPTVADIRASCAERSCKAPAAADAWAEVMRAVGTVGRYRVPQWSHVAVERAVEGLGGWQAICDSEDNMADRAHFLRLYAETRSNEVTKTNLRAIESAHVERRALKAQSVGDVLKALPGGKR